MDRLGSYQRAEGIIVYDNCKKAKEELKRQGGKPSSADHDPIYGTAIGETFQWLKKQEQDRPRRFKDEINVFKAQAKKLVGEAKQEVEEQLSRRMLVDFGVLALEVPTGDELRKLLAPRPSAPTLLPAYMDLWAQTSPPPCQLPEVSLWLHGPDYRPPDVQVIWRADLAKDTLERKDRELAATIVSAVRPSSLEAMRLPLPVVRAWLAGKSVPDMGDTEGEVVADDVLDREDVRLALRWNGDESEIIPADSLRQGDTVVVPASYGGIRGGCFDPACSDPVTDRAEQVNLFARGRPVLRLHPEVTKVLDISIPLEDAEEAREALAQLADNDTWPAWKRLWAQKLARSRRSFAVPGEPGWTVLEATRVPFSDLRQVLQSEETLEDGVELTTDAEDSCYSGCAVSLAEHSLDLEALVREHAQRCGLDPFLAEHIAIAAWLHDVGKADPRFQLMLRGGSQIEYFKDETPLAKSATPAGARAERQLARKRSGYPEGARHEVQSLAMLSQRKQVLEERLKRICSSRQPDLDLILYLVSSHHGYCRPFAPFAIDDQPVDICLPEQKSEVFGTIDFPTTSSQHNLHRLDSPLADRFWQMVNRYGWLELCWLETILRLADHRASEEEERRKRSS